MAGPNTFFQEFIDSLIFLTFEINSIGTNLGTDSNKIIGFNSRLLKAYNSLVTSLENGNTISSEEFNNAKTGFEKLLQVYKEEIDRTLKQSNDLNPEIQLLLKENRDAISNTITKINSPGFSIKDLESLIFNLGSDTLKLGETVKKNEFDSEAIVKKIEETRRDIVFEIKNSKTDTNSTVDNRVDFFDIIGGLISRAFEQIAKIANFFSESTKVIVLETLATLFTIAGLFFSAFSSEFLKAIGAKKLAEKTVDFITSKFKKPKDVKNDQNNAITDTSVKLIIDSNNIEERTATALQLILEGKTKEVIDLLIKQSEQSNISEETRNILSKVINSGDIKREVDLLLSTKMNPEEEQRMKDIVSIPNNRDLKGQIKFALSFYEGELTSFEANFLKRLLESGASNEQIKAEIQAELDVSNKSELPEQARFFLEAIRNKKELESIIKLTLSGDLILTEEERKFFEDARKKGGDDAARRLKLFFTIINQDPNFSLSDYNSIVNDPNKNFETKFDLILNAIKSKVPGAQSLIDSLTDVNKIQKIKAEAEIGIVNDDLDKDLSLPADINEQKIELCLELMPEKLTAIKTKVETLVGELNSKTNEVEIGQLQTLCDKLQSIIDKANTINGLEVKTTIIEKEEGGVTKQEVGTPNTGGGGFDVENATSFRTEVTAINNEFTEFNSEFQSFDGSNLNVGVTGAQALREAKIEATSLGDELNSIAPSANNANAALKNNNATLAEGSKAIETNKIAFGQAAEGAKNFGIEGKKANDVVQSETKESKKEFKNLSDVVNDTTDDYEELKEAADEAGEKQKGVNSSFSGGLNSAVALGGAVSALAGTLLQSGDGADESQSKFGQYFGKLLQYGGLVAGVAGSFNELNEQFRITDRLSGLMNTGFGNTLKLLGGTTLAMFQYIGALITGNTEKRKELALTIRANATKLAEGIANTAVAVAKGVYSAATWLATAATAAFSIALNSTGIPAIILGIAALVGGIVLLIKNFEKITSVVSNAFSAVGNFFGSLFGFDSEEATKEVRNGLDDVIEESKEAGGEAASAFNDEYKKNINYDGLSEKQKEAADEHKKFVDNIIKQEEKLNKTSKDLTLKNIADKRQAALDAIEAEKVAAVGRQKLLLETGAISQQTYDNEIAAIQNLTETAIDNANQFFDSQKGDLKNALNDTLNAFSNEFENAKAEIESKASNFDIDGNLTINAELQVNKAKEKELNNKIAELKKSGANDLATKTQINKLLAERNKLSISNGKLQQKAVDKEKERLKDIRDQVKAERDLVRAINEGETSLDITRIKNDVKNLNDDGSLTISAQLEINALETADAQTLIGELQRELNEGEKEGILNAEQILDLENKIANAKNKLLQLGFDEKKLIREQIKEIEDKYNAEIEGIKAVKENYDSEGNLTAEANLKIAKLELLSVAEQIAKVEKDIRDGNLDKEEGQKTINRLKEEELKLTQQIRKLVADQSNLNIENANNEAAKNVDNLNADGEVKASEKIDNTETEIKRLNTRSGEIDEELKNTDDPKEISALNAEKAAIDEQLKNLEGKVLNLKVEEVEETKKANREIINNEKATFEEKQKLLNQTIDLIKKQLKLLDDKSKTEGGLSAEDAKRQQQLGEELEAIGQEITDNQIAENQRIVDEEKAQYEKRLNAAKEFTDELSNIFNKGFDDIGLGEIEIPDLSGIFDSIGGLKDINKEYETLNSNIDTLKEKRKDVKDGTKEAADLDKEIAEGEAKLTELETQKAVKKTEVAAAVINAATEAASSIVNQLLANTEQELEKIDEEIQTRRDVLDEEKEKEAEGYANSVAIQENAIKKLEKQREKAQKKKEKLAKAQMALDTIQQASSLALASAQLYASVAPLGPAGPAIAGVLIGIMIAGFIASKALALSAANKQGKYEGGYTGGGNPREESGHFTHKQEYVIPHKPTQKYRKNLLEGIHYGERAKIMEGVARVMSDYNIDADEISPTRPTGGGKPNTAKIVADLSSGNQSLRRAEASRNAEARLAYEQKMLSELAAIKGNTGQTADNTGSTKAFVQQSGYTKLLEESNGSITETIIDYDINYED